MKTFFCLTTPSKSLQHITDSHFSRSHELLISPFVLFIDKTWSIASSRFLENEKK